MIISNSKGGGALCIAVISVVWDRYLKTFILQNQMKMAAGFTAFEEKNPHLLEYRALFVQVKCGVINVRHPHQLQRLWAI